MTDFPPPGGSSGPPPPGPGSAPGPGWWQASDGNWYPPDQQPGYGAPAAYGVPAGYGYGYPVPPVRSTNGFAIASLVVSLVSCGLGSILGVIFGHVALSQIKRNDEGGKGLAIAGLVIGYIGLVGLVLFIVIVIAARNSTNSDFQINGNDFGIVWR